MMKFVWLTALLFALASFVGGVIWILWLALRGEPYAAYVLQSVLALALMGIAWNTLRQRDNKRVY